MLGEFDVIRDYFSDVGAFRDDVAVGVGDDGAVISPSPQNQLVAVTDTLVESIHFPRTSPARSVGHRSIAVNLSDMTAMAARPAWATLNISLPSSDRDWLADFTAGFGELAVAHRVQLIGGDTVRGPLVVTVQLLGEVAPEHYVLRSGAQPGDAVYVTGTLGDAAAGLRAMTRGDVHGWLVDRFLYPEPRVSLSAGIGRYCSAAIDVSDGFGKDLERVLQASGVGACVDLEALPLSAHLARNFNDDESRYLAISGGDDYEICMTVPPHAGPALEEFCQSIECPVTRVGIVESAPGLRFKLGGQAISVNVHGHDHFVTDE
ncbi:MAG: thiamine-phosphate kinase [Gammaproteobacteria bacterium]|nr:thiamine-phosphate kinase [Gammaproteobacteria bacterium]